MAFTSSDLVALDRAIASGELSVAYDGKRVEYRSIAELQVGQVQTAIYLQKKLLNLLLLLLWPL